jgi:thioredoxin-related protein/tetratricopeptide (TPR) repeat protein
MLIVGLLATSACSERSENQSADRAAPGPQIAASEQNGIRWFEDTIDEAFAAAKQQQKPVFLYWGEEWCPYCNRLQSTVFVRDQFITLSHEFIALDLGTDTEEKIEYGDRFGIRGFPTVIVFNPDGEALTRIDGAADIEQYARVLETTLGSIRPVGELVRSVQAGEELGPGEWTLLVNYSWREEPGQALAEDANLHAVLRTLSEAVPEDLASVKRRLKMRELSAWLSDDNRDGSLVPAYRDFLQVVLADDEMFRENLGAIAFGADEIIPLVIPEDQQAATRDRILEEIYIELEDPATLTLERIELLMGWLNVSTATLGEEDELTDQQVEWLKQQAAAARAALPDDQLQSGLYSLSGLYRSAGLIDEARDVARQGAEEAEAPYYFMVILASLESDQGNLDEALAWYEKAWHASRGPTTRVRWGGMYLNRLVKISPDNVTAIRDTSLQLLAEISGQDNWLSNYERTIGRLSDTLLEWSTATPSNEREAVVDDVRTEMQSQCGKVAMASEVTATCEKFLVPA